MLCSDRNAIPTVPAQAAAFNHERAANPLKEYRTYRKSCEKGG
jgi:hypothetical protein